LLKQVKEISEEEKAKIKKRVKKDLKFQVNNISLNSKNSEVE
jgi:hypothetical protein